MLEEEAPPPTPRPGVPDTSYHFALSGKSFSVILEHFPDLLPKVGLWSRAKLGPGVPWVCVCTKAGNGGRPGCSLRFRGVGARF